MGTSPGYLRMQSIKVSFFLSCGSLTGGGWIPYPMLISATQEFETTDLDIVYKVTDTDDANVTTGLLAYIDGDDSFENVIIPKSFLVMSPERSGKMWM